MDEMRRKPLSDTTAAGTLAVEKDAHSAEREEFISRLCHHPELCSVLLRILVPQEPPHEGPEGPHHNGG